MSEKIAFLAADTDSAQAALHELTEIYGQCDFKTADYIVALGGDGFMLQTLHLCQNLRAPVYGMNRGTVGFMMNAYEIKALPLRLANAEQQIINPLIMKATLVDGKVETALAINEVSLLRAGPQAAKLKIWVDNRQRMEELVCDGVLVATPAGSTAYNYSAHGPILPIGADVLAMTALNAYRPRRWRGALLPKTSIVRIDVLDNNKRPVMADADSVSFKNVKKVEISSETKIKHKILFNQGHGLDERLIQEQFV
ncbi:NAD kinase [Paracoccaceae bacterium]|jgi:NAD+ kinase|nr:NAD kinase [Paracoccaceae bacterium]MDB3930449.1 NAD kinase [Paracoccaceae bacterium]|tara:strand:- start:471 stop:1232 length:762 start_codon:yes stop_codon:yes gene_type:complete